MHDMLADEKKNAIKNLIKVIFFGVCVGFGAYILLKEGSNGVLAYFLIAGIGCVPTNLKSMSNNLKDDIRYNGWPRLMAIIRLPLLI